MAKNGFGDATACGLVDVITKLPELDSDDNNAEIIIASSTVIGVILLLVICLILYYALNQKKKRKQTDLLARNVVLWAKRVTVSQVHSILIIFGNETRFHEIFHTRNSDTIIQMGLWNYKNQK